jgi:hypothetical protein
MCSLLGCRREEPATYYVNQAMLAYCWFAAGSYWVYEDDSVPGVLDSAYVTNTYETILPAEGEGFQAERYGNGMVMEGKLYGQTRDAWPTSGEKDITVMTEGISGEGISDVVFFWDDDWGGGTSYYGGMVARRLDSVVVRGVTYFDAIRVSCHPSGNAGCGMEVDWVRDVGAVRRVRGGRSWSLIRYSIAPWG